MTHNRWMAVFAAAFVVTSVPARGLELTYRRVEPNHDFVPSSNAPDVPVVASPMPVRPLSHPFRTIAELNRGGTRVFDQRGALPYVALGIAALASDKHTEKWFRVSAPGEPRPGFAKTFNHFGDGKVILPAMAVLYLAGGGEGKDTSKLWAAAVINSTFWTQSIKMLTGKERPNKSPNAVKYNGPGSLKNDSFPSGHMTLATTTAVILGHEYPRYKLPLYALAACVGIARIEGRDHWPSDVYWGAGVGYYGAWQALRHRDSILKWRF
jgi:membrane-associated phospholipid phosphatase